MAFIPQVSLKQNHDRNQRDQCQNGDLQDSLRNEQVQPRPQARAQNRRRAGDQRRAEIDLPAPKKPGCRNRCTHGLHYGNGGKAPPAGL